MSLPNIAVRDLEVARTASGIVDSQISRKSDAGRVIIGSNGEQKTPSLQTYRSWLEQFFANYGADEPEEPTTLLNV